MRRILFHLAVMGLLLPAGQGQVQSSLSGTVLDRYGSELGGVQVTARNVDTGRETRTVTGEAAIYVFPALVPGNYEILCAPEGYKSYIQTGIVLETGFAHTVDLMLERLESGGETRVSALGRLAEVEDLSYGELVGQDMLAHVPVKSRRSAELAWLSPTVTFLPDPSDGSTPKFFMAGGRLGNQMWLLDGGVAQKSTLDDPEAAVNPPAESVREFKVNVTGHSSELGRAGSGLVVMTTKSGGNDFHGSAYEYFSSENLNSRSYFASEPDGTDGNVFGASLGGPLVRNRAFFFLNYEGRRQTNGTTIAEADVPHLGERSGDFSNRETVEGTIDAFELWDPEFGDDEEPFPNNTIPQSRIDSLGQALANLYPAPNVATDIREAPGNNYVAAVEDRVEQDFLTGRLDYSGAKDSYFLRFSWAKGDQTLGSLFPNPLVDTRAGDRDEQQLNAAFNWVRYVSPEWTNELRLSQTRYDISMMSAGAGSNLNQVLGIQGVDQASFAQILVDGYSALGQLSSSTRLDPMKTTDFSDTVTWVRGGHVIKGGLEVRTSSARSDSTALLGGSFRFTNYATQDALATLLLGDTSAGDWGDAPVLNTRSNYYAFFAQDEWKATRRLTLTGGLRWEMDTPRTEESNLQSSFNRDIQIRLGEDQDEFDGAVTFAGRDLQDRRAHLSDTNNIGPRLGFAYRAEEGLMIRGSFGVYFTGAYAGSLASTQYNGFGPAGSFISTDGGFTPAFQLSSGLPPISEEDLSEEFGAVAEGQSPYLSPDFIEQDHQNGRVQQYNLSIQQQLGGDMTAEISYFVARGKNLSGPDININMTPVSGGRGTSDAEQENRDYPQFNNVWSESPSFGSSSYRAFTARIEKRYTHGLNFSFSYTNGKFTDDIAGGGNPPGTGYTHVNRREQDESISDLDIKHRLVAYVMWDLPAGRPGQWGGESPILSAVTRDWRLGILSELRSGRAYGTVDVTNATNTFSHANRPDLTGSIQSNTNWQIDVLQNPFFNPTVFERAQARSFGSAARNVGYGPGYVGLDLSLQRDFRIRESHLVQFRADLFDALNRANFSNPSGAFGSGDFGLIGSVLPGSGGRSLQVSLRYQF